MGQLEAAIVPQFQGIRQPGMTGEVTRRYDLATPTWIYNFHHTSDGDLYMPSAAELVHDFANESGEDENSEIISVHYIEAPRGLVVQMDSGQIFHVAIQPPSEVNFGLDGGNLIIKKLAQMGTGEEQWPIWVNGAGSYSLMGYAPRGTAGPDTDGKTWKIHGSWDDPEVTDLTTTVTPTASFSTFYKGRRFWVKRGRNVYFSDLNTFDEARPEDNEFRISGDWSGLDHLTNPGFVRGMVAWEDILVFFLGGSVWALSGSGIDTYQLRQVQTIAGNLNDRLLNRTDEGILTVGGNNLNNRSLYLFTGSRAVDLGEDVQQLFKSLGSPRGASISAGKYVMSVGRANEAHRQFMIYDMRTQRWTLFDGFVRGCVLTQPGRIVTTEGPNLYRNTQEIFPRKPGRGARYISGFQDDSNPSGLLRYSAIKLTGRRWGGGSPTLTVTIRTDTSTVVSDPQVIPTDEFDNFVIPLNVRGAAIQVELEITPANDDTEVLIENMQLIFSRKGEKVSRG